MRFMYQPELKEEIDDIIRKKRIINTHCHVSTDDQFFNADLNLLWDKSYLNWVCSIPRNCSDSRLEFINRMESNNYFYYLDKAVTDIHGVSIRSCEWENLNKQIIDAYHDRNFFLKGLKEYCGYDKCLLDNCRNPGFNNDHPDIFFPVLRIDSLFCLGEKDFNGVSALNLLHEEITSFEDYISTIKSFINHKIKNSEIYAIKIAIAYDFSFEFYRDRLYEKAKDAFDGKDDLKYFRNYLMHCVADIAEENNIPVQIHTGIAPQENNRAYLLFPIIKSHPNTKFVIFHGSIPWTDDVIALLHLCRNAYTDLCWMPLISNTITIDFIKKCLEVGNADRICWGCDTRMFEESYAAALAMKDSLSCALAGMIDDGRLSLDSAKHIIHRILYRNANDLYFDRGVF